MHGVANIYHRQKWNEIIYRCLHEITHNGCEIKSERSAGREHKPPDKNLDYY